LKSISDLYSSMSMCDTCAAHTHATVTQLRTNKEVKSIILTGGIIRLITIFDVIFEGLVDVV